MRLTGQALRLACLLLLCAAAGVRLAPAEHAGARTDGSQGKDALERPQTTAFLPILSPPPSLPAAASAVEYEQADA